jgi:hypothetical protein
LGHRVNVSLCGGYYFVVVNKVAVAARSHKVWILSAELTERRLIPILDIDYHVREASAKITKSTPVGGFHFVTCNDVQRTTGALAFSFDCGYFLVTDFIEAGTGEDLNTNLN